MRHLLRIVVTAVLATGLPTLAAAQGIANSLHELRLLVRPGESVTVIDTSGHAVKGRIASLSASQIVLETPSGRQQWREGDVRGIRQRRGDSLGNGATIGFGVGAALGLAGGLALRAAGDAGDGVGLVMTVAAVYGGLGAGIGVGLDALITREYAIFEPAPRTTLRVHPWLTPRARGVRLSLAF